jgi:hypothetical protein
MHGKGGHFAAVRSSMAASGEYDESQSSEVYDDVRVGSNTSYDYGVLWKLLWLYPNISELATGLVADLERGWDYDTAFLLATILDLQTTYQRYLESSSTSQGPTRLSTSALLTRDIVLRVVRTCAGQLIPYATHGPDGSLGRDLQSRVVAMALSLFKHLDARNLSSEVDHDIRSNLWKRDSEVETNDAASAGDGQLLIRYSLSFLSDIPSDRGGSFAYVRAISSLFFVPGLIVST